MNYVESMTAESVVLNRPVFKIFAALFLTFKLFITAGV